MPVTMYETAVSSHHSCRTVFANGWPVGCFGSVCSVAASAFVAVQHYSCHACDGTAAADALMLQVTSIRFSSLRPLAKSAAAPAAAASANGIMHRRCCQRLLPPHLARHSSSYPLLQHHLRRNGWFTVGISRTAAGWRRVDPPVHGAASPMPRRLFMGAARLWLDGWLVWPSVRPSVQPILSVSALWLGLPITRSVETRLMRVKRAGRSTIGSSRSFPRGCGR